MPPRAVSSAVSKEASSAVGASFVPVIVKVSDAVLVSPCSSVIRYVNVSVAISPSASAWAAAWLAA